MDVEHEIGEIASLIGEPARAMMLWNLTGGQARPAGELAYYANVSAQNASAHLSKLVEAGLLLVEARGRHRYYRIATPEVAHAIEAMAALIPSTDRNSVERSGQLPRGQTPDLKYARTCYDHLAGRIAVAICDTLTKKGLLTPESKEYAVPSQGEIWFRDLGIDLSALRQQRRAFAPQCHDWSERRPHLAGALGAALLSQMFRQYWIARVHSTRIIRVTNKGKNDLYKLLGLHL